MEPSFRYNASVQDLVKQAEKLLADVRQAVGQLDVEQDRRRVAELEQDMTAADFWQRPDAAAVSQQAAGLRKHAESWQAMEEAADELVQLTKLADADMEAEIRGQLKKLTAEFERRQFELKLAGPYDRNSAILSIYAGTGGTDAQDWAEMLLRMYLRWCEKTGYQTAILDQSAGEEAGIKSATVEIGGPFAYGRLRGEKGVHRLVRLSPFNADNLRQTSFALVEVVPQIERPDEIEIDPKDLRVDVFRSGGHGGQSVNTTDSAVRLTHLPTGITVSIQNERSQLQNKDKAMAVLKSRLAALMEEQHQAKVSEIKGQVQSAAWGNQIRSYVLHPYTKVKDHRTGAETSAAQDVLDGDIDQFIEAYLQSQIGHQPPEKKLRS